MLLFTKEQLRDDVILWKAKQKDADTAQQSSVNPGGEQHSEIQLHKY